VSALQRLPFWAALIIVAAGTAGGVYVGVRTANLLWVLVTLVIVVAFAVVYLREYSQLPGPPETDPYRAPPPVTASQPTSSTEPPSVGAAAPASTVEETGEPVEQDAFDPNYDPVAEADRLESTAPPPKRPDDEPPTEP